jgi:hypothetical protein
MTKALLAAIISVSLTATAASVLAADLPCTPGQQCAMGPYPTPAPSGPINSRKIQDKALTKKPGAEKSGSIISNDKAIR